VSLKRKVLPTPAPAAARVGPQRSERRPSIPEPRIDAPEPPVPVPSQEGFAWQSFPLLERSPAAAELAHAAGGIVSAELGIAIEVAPRKPRLVWQGHWRKEVAVSVPTQVVEIVRPGRAIVRNDQLTFDTRIVAVRDTTSVPPNRLIWTNDNLVALQTLVDEKDPVTRDWRYRGKVDLVYIDPPFMVNNDFRTDNTIDINLDGDAGVQAKKEPSLVEILAYRDTWHQGLDSFLTMLRARLVLLKELLAPTASIYVHLDWHAVHYVKVLMDELFGYENFRNEIVWQRTTAHNDPKQFGRVNDRLLFYVMDKKRYYFETVYSSEYSPEQLTRYKDADQGGFFTGRDLTAPGIRHGETGKPWRGLDPNDSGRHWARLPAELEQLLQQGKILLKKDGTPRLDGLKVYLSETPGPPAQDVWTDIGLSPTTRERTGYPTQKPVSLVERVISASCPPHGLVLDCFLGSGTTIDAAERLGRRWIGIDCSKYAIHLARKRLIQLHGQPRGPEKSQSDYIECDECKRIERKERAGRSPGPYQVRPFTLENMGVYQRAAEWQDFQLKRSRYRDEMVKVFGGETVAHSPLLHGRKGPNWVHVGPLDGPISEYQVWSIAREASRTNTKAVTVLSADFDTLSASEKDRIKEATGVALTVRVIPSAALAEVRRRIALEDRGIDSPVESMAIPAFYAPLSIVLAPEIEGRTVRLRLERCEVDMDSFLSSQRPADLKPSTGKMTLTQQRKTEDARKKWTNRQSELQRWLKRADSWQKFVDFWAIDWDYGTRVNPDDKPIFENHWQSFRLRKSKAETEPLVFVAEFQYTEPGQHWIAARVTDVFGNDGIATVKVRVK
jgi:adenine-specific DNA-methyltransferase